MNNNACQIYFILCQIYLCEYKQSIFMSRSRIALLVYSIYSSTILQRLVVSKRQASLVRLNTGIWQQALNHIEQYHCGYFKMVPLRVLWRYSDITLWQKLLHPVTVEYPHSTLSGILTCSSHINTVWYKTHIHMRPGGIWKAHILIQRNKFSPPSFQE